MKKNNKLLIVSWGVYPMPTGSSVIVDNIATNFPHSKIVLIGEKVHNLQKGKDNKDRTNTYYVNPNISVFGKGQRYFRWLKLNKTIKTIRSVAKKENCTAILAIFPDEFYMYAAYKVSQEMNLPFYTWFHNTYLDNRKGLFKLLAKRWQPKFFSAARINFVMSDGMLNFYNEKYPHWNFCSLVHGFEIPNVTYTPPSPVKGKIKLMYSGNINESCLDATLRLFDAIRKKPNYELHIYGKEANMEYYNIDIGKFIIHGFVTWEKFVASFEDYDIMLLSHGFDGQCTEIEYKTIFPTRTIPLLYSNRPILAHSPKGVFLTDFLRKNDCAEIVDERDENAIHVAIERLLNNEQHREKLIQNAIRTAARFDIKNVTQQLRQAIFHEEV